MMASNQIFVPTQKQLDASNPAQSVWVAANAGSGKTHVLVERVIRLLLSGAAPASILCITYTKAAAAEMTDRLFKRLGGWAALSDIELSGALNALGENGSNSALRQRARQLFTLALETPGGLKIQTIHAFCERLLQLFPVEAGMAPGFRVMDERASAEMQARATARMIAAARSGPATLGEAFTNLSNQTNAEQFSAIVTAFLKALRRFPVEMQTISSADYGNLIKKDFGIALDETLSSIVASIDDVDRSAYHHHAAVLKPYGTHNRRLLHELLAQVARSVSPRSALQDYFFTKGGDQRKPSGLCPAAVKSSHPATAAFFDSELLRLAELFQREAALQTIQASADALLLAQSVHENMKTEKRRLGLYDFDDLISRTARLLSSAISTQWVLYKLDAGLSHILLDEAQDTSPAQWQIIRALAEEFFSGLANERKAPRTLFVVGDQKQSIYSFQGADAPSFGAMRHEFVGREFNGSPLMQPVDLAISYRSTSAVLDDVNKVFPPTRMETLGILGSDEQVHEAHRKSEAGRVELWPLVRDDPDEDDDEPWTKPIDRPPQSSARRLLARQIAQKISAWLNPARPRLLGEQGAPVRPQDILILFQSRSPLFAMLLAELRKAGVPVAGADRLQLLDSLIVQDLVVLLEWLQLPEDDHALAVILKSPLVPQPVSEEQLLALCANRGDESLIGRLAGSNATFLNELKISAGSVSPYALLAGILSRTRSQIRARLGEEAIEASDAMLDLALDYGREHGTSLFGFLHWFTASDTELKREMDKASGAVRLMTVHGAKGLEAPIVILADASTVSGRGGGRMTVLNSPKDFADGLLPLWLLPVQKLIHPGAQRWKDNNTRLAEQERLRLLYVAMTRAADELYMTGIRPNGKDALAQSWWALLTAALGEPGAANLSSAVDTFGMQSRPTSQSQSSPLPAWLKITPLPERSSAPIAATWKAHSGRYDAKAARHGRAVHKLLEELLDVAEAERSSLAQRRAIRLGLSTAEAARLVAATGLPELAPFLGAGSRPEADILGKLSDGRPISGRLDRLRITEEGIWLLDYKTDRSITESIAIYLRQMATSVDLLSQAYPGRPIQAALFWTHTNRLQRLTSEELTTALREGERSTP